MCLTDKSDFWQMGTVNDTAKHQRLKREDTSTLRNWISRAREWIFQDGDSPEGTNVKKTVLHDTSTCVTQVSTDPNHHPV